MTILCRESRLYSIAIFLLPSFDLDKNICKNKRVPLTENNKTIYNPIFDSYKTKKIDAKKAGTIRSASIFLIFNCQTPVTGYREACYRVRSEQ